ncbi:hypothetical protein Tco_1309864 [Tanacetum coccineum]
MKGQDNPLIPNLHPHLLNSTIEKPIIVPSSYQHKKTHKPRKAIRTTEISQSSRPSNLVAYETVYKEWEDILERVATTVSCLDAEQDSDAQTRIETTSKQSNDPPLSRGYTLRSGEDSMKLLELMELCTKLSDLLAWGLVTCQQGCGGSVVLVVSDYSAELGFLFFAAGVHLSIGVTVADGGLQTLFTPENGEMEITATIDGNIKVVSEASIRRYLKLEDSNGISTLPNAEIFEQLTLMGVCVQL